MKESLDKKRATDLETTHVVQECSHVGGDSQKEPQEPKNAPPVVLVEADILLLPTLPRALPSPPTVLLRAPAGKTYAESIPQNPKMFGSASASFLAPRPARTADYPDLEHPLRDDGSWHGCNGSWRSCVLAPDGLEYYSSPRLARGLPSLTTPVLGAQSIRLQSPGTSSRSLFSVDLTSDMMRRAGCPAASSPVLL